MSAIDAVWDIRRRLGARPLINLTGTLTAYGGISARPEAIEAAAAIMGRGVDIVELQACASRIIAEATGSEAGFVAACSSAGICMAIAGAMTGSDLALIERLPDTAGMRSGVVIQTGHLVNYGHSISQDIRQTGARVVAIGDANASRTHQLEAALGPETAAALYVVSHHCMPYGQIPFADFVRVCHERSIPVIVDLAAEYDLTGYLRQGADVTIHSSHKFLGGATAGIVAGRKDLVRAAYLQTWGIGRPMKVGKEGVAGALAALERWRARDHDAERRRARMTLELLAPALRRLPRSHRRSRSGPDRQPVRPPQGLRGPGAGRSFGAGAGRSARDRGSADRGALAPARARLLRDGPALAGGWRGGGGRRPDLRRAGWRPGRRPGGGAGRRVSVEGEEGTGPGRLARRALTVRVLAGSGRLVVDSLRPRGEG